MNTDITASRMAEVAIENAARLGRQYAQEMRRLNKAFLKACGPILPGDQIKRAHQVEIAADAGDMPSKLAAYRNAYNTEAFPKE
mgnify:CR=1 FL=1